MSKSRQHKAGLVFRKGTLGFWRNCCANYTVGFLVLLSFLVLGFLYGIIEFIARKLHMPDLFNSKSSPMIVVIKCGNCGTSVSSRTAVRTSDDWTCSDCWDKKEETR